MEILETERLILRSWQKNDLDDLYEYARDPNVGPNAGWKPHADKGESLEILLSFIESTDTWAMMLRENEKVIGSISLMADTLYPKGNDRSRMLGYAMSYQYWGRGLMTEAARRVLEFAFQEMGLDFVSCSHFPFNARSKRVIEKCGFHYQKSLKGSYINYRHEKLDEVCYVLTRADYFSHLSAM